MALAERNGPADVAGGASLVLYGERSTEAPPARCPNAAPGLRLAVKDLDGPRYLPVRCGRRACRFCGWLRDLEDATCLFLDARDGEQPTMAITLTTAQPWEELDPGAYRRASSQLWRALRARWGRVEYCGLVEFTTGRAKRSGGKRRMHGHYLVKGIPGDQVLDVEAVVREVWARCTGAYVVEVAELRSAGGAIAYMGLHHRKPQQAPPDGWRGMRLRASQGYWHVPVAALRETARRHLAVRVKRHKLEQAGATPEWAAVAAELEVDAQREAVREHGVELVRVREHPGGVVTPIGPVERAHPAQPDSPDHQRSAGGPSPVGRPQAEGAALDEPPERSYRALRAPPDRADTCGEAPQDGQRSAQARSGGARASAVVEVPASLL